MMKCKTLVALAVASTFGWSASALAGSSHEVVTPLSVNEAGEVFAQDPSHVGFSGQQFEQFDMTALGATSSHAEGQIGGSFDHSASLTMDQSLSAADQGFYNDYYVVSWTPVMVETWDVYLIEPDQLAAAEDTYFILPSHELALIPSSSDEMVYDVVLTPIVYDDMISSYSFDHDAASGE